jgi:hypothetical protein
MRFAEKLVVVCFRPIYRTLFERLLWWFLTRVKAFFFAETTARLDSIKANLAQLNFQIEQLTRRIAETDVKVSSLLSRPVDTSAVTQWESIEQLLLAMFRQSEPDFGHDSAASRTHEASNIR